MSAGAKDLKRKLVELAAPILQADASALDIQEGRVFVKSAPEHGMSVKEVLWQGDLNGLTINMSRQPDAQKTGIPYFATFAEVDVDTDTGRIEVHKLIMLNDCGTVMYASGAEAQQIGGQYMGMGETLTEELIYDEASGIPLNFNFIDYKIPTMADMPEIEPVLLEVWRGAGEYAPAGLAKAP